MNDVTYGSLMDQAEDHLKIAWRQLRHAPPADASSVREAVLTFKELGHALTGLATHLTGEDTETPRTSRLLDPRLRAAMHLVDAMADVFATRPEPLRNLAPYSLAARLKAAAVSVRAATELLASHAFPDGRWKTPESVPLGDLPARLAALARVSDLAAAMNYAQPALSRASREHEMDPTWKKDIRIRDLRRVRVLALELRSLVSADAGSVIDQAQIATPSIRQGEPVIELQDRIERLRIAAWRAAVYPSNETGVPTLIDFATAAVMLHGRAALLGARINDVNVRDPQAPAEVRFFFTRADGWRGVRRQLLGLVSPSIPDPMVAEDVRALRALLGDLTKSNHVLQRSRTTNPRFTGIVAPHDVTEAARKAAEVFEDIAAHNSMTARRLHSENLLTTPGKLLPAVEGMNTLTQGFTRTVVPLTAAKMRLLLNAYRAIHTRPDLGVPDVFQPPHQHGRQEPGAEL